MNPAQAANPAAPSAPGKTQREADLAAGGSGQELTERDQVGETVFADPMPAHHELAAEIAQMRDGPAERGQAQAQKDLEDVERPRRPAQRWSWRKFAPPAAAVHPGETFFLMAGLNRAGPPPRKFSGARIADKRRAPVSIWRTSVPP